MVRLVSLVTSKPIRDIERVQFPICSKPESFTGVVSEVRQIPAFSGYLTRIEELQPFNRGNASIWGSEWEKGALGPHSRPHALPVALNRLSILDNLDKHRIIHATWVGIDPTLPWHINPPGGECIGGSTHLGTLEDGAEIGTLDFDEPWPADWEPNQMDVKRQFPIQVSLYDELRFADRVLEVLPFCIWGVESVLRIFEPVCRIDSEPPLPVTVIPTVPIPLH
jgi:hypothetical protein